MTRMRQSLVEQILSHAEDTYPHECCGFVLGHVADGARVATEVRRAGNERQDSPKNRYQIAPEEFLRVEREARSEGLEVLGFYHSHPDHPPVPSEYDREHAWPWYVYLIVPVAAGRAGSPRAFVLQDPERVFVEEGVEKT